MKTLQFAKGETDTVGFQDARSLFQTVYFLFPAPISVAICTYVHTDRPLSSLWTYGYCFSSCVGARTERTKLPSGVALAF